MRCCSSGARRLWPTPPVCRSARWTARSRCGTAQRRWTCPRTSAWTRSAPPCVSRPKLLAMAVSAASSLRWPRAQVLARARIAVPVGLGVLATLSVLVRTERFDVGYWIDEGLSVGIADRPFTDIPGVLRQDGSPPAYYLLLHLWIRVFGGTGEETTHALSLTLATLTIPVAYVLVRALFGGRAGWIAAVLFAFVPFLNTYAQETRMYALVVLCGLVSVCCFTGAFALGRGRGWTVGFAVAHAALLWTHNWGFFLGAGLAAAWAVLVALAPPPERRRLVRAGLGGAGGG